MNPKIDLNELKEMTYAEYVKRLQKEVKRASIEGRTDFLVLSDFMFKGETEPHTLLIFGKFTGKMQKFYKKQLKERAGSKDFARGSAYFEEQGDGTTTVHLNMEAGKAKSSKIKKNGKKMFNKLGLDIQLQEPEVDLDEVEVNEIISETEQEETVGAAEELVENKNMRRIHKDYLNAFAQINEVIVPKIKTSASVTADDFEQAKQLHILSQAYVQEYDTLKPRAQEKYAPTLEKVKANAVFVEKIFAKVKQMATAQNLPTDDITVVTNQALNDKVKAAVDAIFDQANALTAAYKDIEAAIVDQEQNKPLEPTNLSTLITELKANIDALKQSAATTEYFNQEKQNQLNAQLQTLQNQLAVASQKATAFEKERIESKVIIKDFNETWSAISELAKNSQRIIIDKKASKQLFAYEKAILTELCESFEVMIKDIDSKAPYIAKQLEQKRLELNNNLDKIKAFLAQCTLSPHPSGKDAYFNAYAQIDQSQPISTWINTVEKLNKWMLEQEQLAKAFETPVSLNVPFQKQSGATDCKTTADAMVINYAKQQGLNTKDFKVRSFNTADGSGYISIAKEDKSKVDNIVGTAGKHYETLENDGYTYQDTAAAAFQYIVDLLNSGKPVVVGVDHTYNRNLYGENKKSSKDKNQGYNNDKTSDHFIVIVGKGMQGGVPYFEYLDPGTRTGAKSADNRLYPLYKGDNQYWYDPNIYNGNSYCLTAVCKYA